MADLIGDADICGAFGDMMGGDGADLRLAYYKYLGEEAACRRFVNLIDTAVMADFCWPPNCDEMRMLMTKYRDMLATSLNDTFCSPDLRLHLTASQKAYDAFESAPPAHIAQFWEAYAMINTAQQSSVINLGIITSKNLAAVRSYITASEPAVVDDGSPLIELPTAENLSDRFITTSAGLNFSPMATNGAIEPVNLKFIYMQQRTPEGKQYWLYFMHKLYCITYSIYTAFVKPDVDPEMFVGIVTDAITKVRGTLQGCDAAFNQILSSVNLMRRNFRTYYKSFSATRNPTEMLEQFVMDVSQTPTTTEGSKSPMLVAQYRRIISKFKDQMGKAKCQKSPIIDKLMKFASKGAGSADKEVVQQAVDQIEQSMAAGPPPVVRRTKKNTRARRKARLASSGASSGASDGASGITSDSASGVGDGVDDHQPPSPLAFGEGEESDDTISG